MKCKTLVLQQIKTPLMSMDNEEQKMIKKKNTIFYFPIHLIQIYFNVRNS